MSALDLITFVEYRNLDMLLMSQDLIFPSFNFWLRNTIYKSSHPEVLLRKDVLKICSKFTGEDPCRSVISIKLQSTI